LLSLSQAKFILNKANLKKYQSCLLSIYLSSFSLSKSI